MFSCNAVMEESNGIMELSRSRPLCLVNVPVMKLGELGGVRAKISKQAAECCIIMACTWHAPYHNAFHNFHNQLLDLHNAFHNFHNQLLDLHNGFHNFHNQLLDLHNGRVDFAQWACEF